MDFSQALTELKHGHKVSREGWNGAGQFAVLQTGYPEGVALNANTARATGIPEGTPTIFRPYLLLHTADGSLVPWAPSASDVLAEDWTAEPVRA